MSNTDHVSLAFSDTFSNRHNGPSSLEQKEMLRTLEVDSIESLIKKTIPDSIRLKKPLNLRPALSEYEALTDIKRLAAKNKVVRTFIGCGYHGTITPPVILRNILENPGWYTQYTPYQAEIAQGRLEALLNFQTMIIDLTGLPVSNASLLDESTACAEAMAMAHAIRGKAATESAPEKYFLVLENAHPQNISVVQTRAAAVGIPVHVCNTKTILEKLNGAFGVLIQYPDTRGGIAFEDYKSISDAISKLPESERPISIFSADLLSLTLLPSPASLGADVCVGSAQRFGVPMGFGGPHAAFLSAKDEFKRLIPGRIIGLSVDADGKPAARLALQTREQHIRREKATSNVCTAQVLLAIMASMYAVYHGPKGLRAIANRIHLLTETLREGLMHLNFKVLNARTFDTLTVELENQASAAQVLKIFEDKGFNLRMIDSNTISVSLDEATTKEELESLLTIFASVKKSSIASVDSLAVKAVGKTVTGSFRAMDYLKHPVFHKYHSETEMLRYMNKLRNKDLSLAQSMIALGSCTMKLNATAEMIPVSFPEFSNIHPFAPSHQTLGYQELFLDLERDLGEITGFAGVSLQPNAGSQGEYAGLLVIKAFHESKGQSARNICLIPKSAHGTNPASAAMVGMKIVVVDCDENGNVDVADLRRKATEHKADLSALMITYPSTHGVFEESIREICEIVHTNGGQVYMDGANMNAQVGYCRPGDFGPDVCHLNLHKTFCIPHGGGGPGMGPIAVAAHLKPFLPGHPIVKTGGENAIGAISAAPWGSPSILPISWMYIRMMGADGLQSATAIAILNANYVARKLGQSFNVLYRGKNGFVAHECIFDFRSIKTKTGVEVEDVAKRLMDYGYHAPTVSFPVAGTIMVEPTESESKIELDRFIDAMTAISDEIKEIETGKYTKENNVLKNAPHTMHQVCATEWNRPYSREKAAFAKSWVAENKFWPAVSRINNVAGDRNLICACPPMDEYT